MVTFLDSAKHRDVEVTTLELGYAYLHGVERRVSIWSIYMI